VPGTRLFLHCLLLFAGGSWRNDADRQPKVARSPEHLRSVIAHPQMGRALQVLGEVRGQSETLISEINREVYRLYEALPAEEQLKQTWFPLLRGLLKWTIESKSSRRTMTV
jgi:hypothetical protein